MDPHGRHVDAGPAAGGQPVGADQDVEAVGRAGVDAVGRGEHDVRADQRAAAELGLEAVGHVALQQGDHERVLAGVGEAAADDLAVGRGRALLAECRGRDEQGEDEGEGDERPGPQGHRSAFVVVRFRSVRRRGR
jgi:hypothetical protein